MIFLVKSLNRRTNIVLIWDAKWIILNTYRSAPRTICLTSFLRILFSLISRIRFIFPFVNRSQE